MTPTRSLAALFLHRIQESPREVAYETRTDGGWRTWTWAEVGRAVREASAGLIARGVEPGNTVGILSGTRVEWMLADFAVLCAGGAVTTVYPSSTPSEVDYVLTDAGVRFVFVEDEAQRAKVGDRESFDLEADWAALRDEGRRWLDTHGEAAWRARIEAVGPEDLATLIYTSGTTGLPKGVRLVHDCWLAQSEALATTIEAHRRPDDKLYVWLPLAHAYGKVLQLVGVAYGLPTAIDPELERLQASLSQVRPTYVPAVPRVFEKMYARIRAQVEARGDRVVRVFDWAERVAIATSRARSRGAVPWGLRAQHALADKLVYRKIRGRLGGRIRAFLSGSAPLSSDLHHFFEGVGLPILEGYGLTECAAVATASKPDRARIGTVGEPADGIEVRISDAGEVLLRGRAVMRGYHGRPDATAEALRDGWFHTGDLGELDADGFLHITGRIKELIITAGGKNIAPAPIEHAIKAACPGLQEVVLVGDRRPYCVALVTVDAEQWTGGPPSEDRELRDRIQAAVDAVNAELPSYSTVKRFAVLDGELTIEGGELTPSQKVRRAVVADKHAARIDALFGG